MRAKDEIISRGHFKIGDVNRRRFWEDTWLGET
jgi:hypothetical protein